MRKPQTILIVEDKGSFRHLCRDFLESRGYRVLLAQDGEEGLRLCLQRKPDLVLLGLRLPGMDGFEVLRGLRAEAFTRSIPVVVCSAMGEEEEIRRAKGMGAAGHVLKGFEPFPDVLEKIQFLIDSGRAFQRSSHTRAEAARQ